MGKMGRNIWSRHWATLLVILTVVGHLSSANAQASGQTQLLEARDSIVHGDYKEARKLLQAITGAQRSMAELELARLSQRTGDYTGAEKRARSLLADKIPTVSIGAHITTSEVLRQTGRYSEAQLLLQSKAQANPKHLGMRHALALAYTDLGNLTSAVKLWNSFYDDYDAGTLDLNNAEHLFYVAEAAKHIDSFQDASDNYQEAVQIDKTFHRANLELAHLFLRKYAPPSAEQSFDEILKLNPNHPDALAGMATIQVSASYDLASAQKYIKKALEINPKHLPSYLLRAGLEIDKNEWVKARQAIDQALAINPESFEARALLATIYWLRDDHSKYAAEKARVLKINPAYAEFFHIVMRSAEREHRYAQAIELGKEAVAINPRDYEAMQLIGTGYLRLGQEKKGLDWLGKAWRGDQYNLRTLNTLDLFEKFIPRQYEFVTSKNFKIRYHKDERAVLDRYITPMMEKAFEDMVKRYGFKPATPVILELYKNAEHYSVRTVGLPNLGALGVCFGQVITAMSPSVGDLNWAMVLWHELSHVFAIQLSDSRVPRWFTEGLSEYETIVARPEWRRENDSDIWAAMQDGSLPSVAELNFGFMKPDMQQVVVAYHLSSVTIEYLVQEYGFDKIVVALKLFAKGKETPEVMEAITGKSVAAFDAEFRRYLRRRLAPYKNSLHLPVDGMRDSKALAKAAVASPKDAMAQARLALGHFYNGNAKESAAAAKQTLSLDKANAIALYISAELALQARDLTTAKRLFETLVAAGHDSFDVRVRLAMIAGQEKNSNAVEGHLQTAKTLDPESSYPYQALSEFFAEQGKNKKATRELETYVMIEQMSLGPLIKLVTAFAKEKQWHKVVTYGELGVNIDPAHGKLQLTLGRAYQEIGDSKQALFAFETALLIRPRLRRPALAHLGRARALRALGKKRDAKAAIERALDLEPENAEALKMSAN